MPATPSCTTEERARRETQLEKARESARDRESARARESERARERERERERNETAGHGSFLVYEALTYYCMRP
jgi:hypothetical protein